MKQPKARQQAQIDLLPLDFDYGHAPADRLGGEAGQVMPVRVRDPQLRERLLVLIQLAKRKLKPDPVRDCERALSQFSADFSRFVVALYGLDPTEPKNVIAVENAYAVLGWIAETSALVWRADFAQLFMAQAHQQLPRLDAAVWPRLIAHIDMLLVGSEIGPMRPLAMRCERRSMGFGWFEDYFKHMSRAQYQRYMREHDILLATMPTLLPALREFLAGLVKNPH